MFLCEIRAIKITWFVIWYQFNKHQHDFLKKVQCTRKTFMIHQTLVRWALYILFRHLGLAIGNVRCVRWFSWTLLSLWQSFSRIVFMMVITITTSQDLVFTSNWSETTENHDHKATSEKKHDISAKWGRVIINMTIMIIGQTISKKLVNITNFQKRSLMTDFFLVTGKHP